MRFLIVDDEPADRQLLVDMLSPLAECDAVDGGDDALDAVRMALEESSPYDVVFLDIMMPQVDGHAVLDAIRRLEVERGVGGSDGVKVVMTTALKDSQHCIRSFREGCESYVTKPVDEVTLLREVESLVGPLRPCRTPGADAPADPSDRGLEASGAEGAASSGSRFLIVDDEEICRALLLEMLEPLGACDLACDGEEAAKRFRDALQAGRPYDLVCLDIMMPGLNGHEVLERFRAVENDCGRFGSDRTPVIMTTALADSKHCIQAFRTGCEAYVVKPFGESDLYKAMRGLGLETVPI